MIVSSRFLAGGLAVAGLLLLAAPGLAAPRDAAAQVYAITDVQVTDDRQAVRDGWAGLPEYTGVTRTAVTLPYLRGDRETRGQRRTATDVNSGVGGTTTTIWVKYERLPRDSSRRVAVDIAVSHWPDWKYAAPDADFEAAHGQSAGIGGALTTRTKGSCWRNGLVVKYKPLSESSSWVLGLYLHCTRNNVPWAPTVNAIAGLPVTAEPAGIDIHKGAGGSYYYLVQLRSAVAGSGAGASAVWREIYGGSYGSPYHQVRSFQYEGRAYLLGQKNVDGRREFYVSRIARDGQGWERNLGTFSLPDCSPAPCWGSCWAVFYLKGHPYVAALHPAGADGWQCTFLRYDPRAQTFSPIGQTSFAGWRRAATESPRVMSLQIKGAPYVLVAGVRATNKPGVMTGAQPFAPSTPTRLYRVSDVCQLDDAGYPTVGEQWREAADLKRRGCDLFALTRPETLAAFESGGETYVFGLNSTGARNQARIWKVNEKTLSLTQTGRGLFPASTLLVLAFQADGQPYLFSLDGERGTGNVWRIADGAAGWARVYWAPHRIAGQLGSLWAGHSRELCTTFELDGAPHLFLKWWQRGFAAVEGPARRIDAMYAETLSQPEQGYIIGLERRNWIRVVNRGAYVAKFYVQSVENGSTVTRESGERPINYEQVWLLPADTRTVLLNAQGHTGFRWNVIHKGEVAVNRTYVAGGTAPAQWLRVEDAAGGNASY